MRDYLLLFINGKEYRVGGADAFKTLSNFLRYDERQTGTKIVCEEGDCGACSVLVGRTEGGSLKYRPINSCIQFLYQLDCSHIVTVEGLKYAGELNPVQEAMVGCHGAQCGFCTPGFIVSMCAMFEGGQKVDKAGVKDALTGNLCRCTGYESIIEAGLAVDADKVVAVNALYSPEPIIEAIAAHREKPVSIEANGKKFCNPTDIAGAVKFKADNPGTVLVAGATDIGVNCNKRGFDPRCLLSISAVAGLDELKVEDGRLVVGGKTSLAALEDLSKELIPELYQVLWTFGGPGIKHAGTLAGNIANGSPIADTVPFLFVTGAEVELTGRKGARRVPVGALYKGYKQLDMEADEIITRIVIPLPKADETLKLYKVSRRKNLDISAFTAAFLMKRSGDTIESVRIAYGGVAAVVMRMQQTESFFAGKPYTLATFEAAGAVAVKEISPISDVRGSKDFRLELAARILRKLYHETAGEKAGERELACR